MITEKIYFDPAWSIEIHTGVEEIVERMGWCMDMEQDKTNPDMWVGIVNLPIEDKKLFHILEMGVLDCADC